MSFRRIYSFVVDTRGEFLWQAKKLIWSLSYFAHVEPGQIVMFVVGKPDPLMQRTIDDLGVVVEYVQPYPGHPWCNKLQQLTPLLKYDADEVVLLDCDIIIIEAPPASDGCVMAKTVDTSNPPMRILSSLFSEAGMVPEPAVATSTGEVTVRGNANGGVYIIPRPCLYVLEREWPLWAAWCMERRTRFEDKLMHVDQVSFAMAIASAHIPFKELDGAYNFPTHFRGENTPADARGKVLHYHRAVDEFFCLRPVDGLPYVNAVIESANEAWLQYLRVSAFDCAYWNAYWKLKAELIARRDAAVTGLQVKRDCLNLAVLATLPQSVCDLGGGDGSVAACVAKYCRIEGADFATESRDAYLKAIPEAQWLLHDARDALGAEHLPDLLVCFDVLPYAASARDFHTIVGNLARANCSLLISGFDATPADLDVGEHFYESLSLALQRLGRVTMPLSSYGSRTVFFCPSAQGSSHERDLKLTTWQAAVPYVDEVPLMLEAVYRSRQQLGFFPDHLPRLIEYPWVVSRLPDGDGLRVIDAGAGVSILPLMMADRGFQVITVDSSSLVRTDTDPAGWNEWGFLDYRRLHPRIESFNQSYESFVLDESVDAVVSVSVIEHLPRTVRGQWLRTARGHLKPGGRLLLTVDTVPHSHDLWNYANGVLVDPLGSHGNILDLEQEIRNAGFVVDLVEYSNWLPQSRVGMARICARVV